MAPYQERRFKIERLLYPCFIMAVLLYLVFHALNGDYGIYALLKEQRRSTTLNETYTQTHAERIAREKRVKGLSDDSLDLDLLDERARAVLGAAKKDEQIYLLPDAEKPTK